MADVYLDYYTATPVDSRVVDSMAPYWGEVFGNPLSRHKWGAQSVHAIESSRQQIAQLINAQPDEIVFTASGSESNNLAIKGICQSTRKKGNHIILSGMEHESVVFIAPELKKQGFEITFLPLDSYGRTKVEYLLRNIRKETILVALSHANGEVGTLQPVEEFGRICKEQRIILFSDGIASVGNVPVDVKSLKVDLMSFASNMFFGPKGVAGLYIRRGVRIKPLIHGGRQENNLRAGTYNVPGIVGMGKAAELAMLEMPERNEYCFTLTTRLRQGLLSKIPGIQLTGHPTARLPNHLSFYIEGIQGEALIMLMELEAGIAASSGSVCGDETSQVSKILLHMGIDKENARGAVRFTVSHLTTAQDIDYAIEKIPGYVERLLAKTSR